MASTPGSGATPEPLQKRRARSPRVLRCARYRVPARPRARAPRSAGLRGATRRPRRPGAPGARRAPTAPRTRRRRPPGNISRRPPEPAGAVRGRGGALPGPRHVCNGRGGALRGAGARREGPRPAGGRARAPRRVERPPTCAPGSPRAATTFPASGAVRPRKGAARPCKRLLLRCAAGSSVSPTARHAARRIIEGYWTLSGALFFVSGNWFCESVTVGARRDFFFARTAQPFGRVRTPGTDQTTRKRVSRRSTSNKRGTSDGR